MKPKDVWRKVLRKPNVSASNEAWDLWEKVEGLDCVVAVRVGHFERLTPKYLFIIYEGKLICFVRMNMYIYHTDRVSDICEHLKGAEYVSNKAKKKVQETLLVMDI